MNVSVIICAYTSDRWHELRAAVASCLDQSLAPTEVVVVVDYNDELLERAREEFGGVIVVANVSTKGLSGARNTGVAVSSGEIVAFLDDDAFADPQWLATLCEPLADPVVVGAGGWIVPSWPTDEPTWFPQTFLWVLGCSYEGLPDDGATIRNPIGASMAMRRRIFESVGGFTTGIGRIGRNALGCEETELSIRYAKVSPGERFVLARRSIVHHRVTAERLTWHYFWTRCWAEGLSKAAISTLVGSKSSLAAERRHALRALPREFIGALAGVFRRPRHSLAKAGLIVAGSVVTGAGLVRGHLALRSKPIVSDTKDLARLTDFMHDSERVRAAAIRGEADPSESVCGLDGGDTTEGDRDGLGPSPVTLVQVDVDDLAATTPCRGSLDGRFMIEVLKRGQVVGVVERRAANGELSVAQLHDVADEYANATTADITRVPDDQLPSVSVVIPTIYKRTDDLARTVDSLLAMDYPNFEVVVVDNRADPGRAPIGNLRSDSRVRIECESRPGISAARNRGIESARGDVIAFTDDDVVVDPQWLRALGSRFVLDPEVDAMGGMVRPRELETRAQFWFEEFFGGFTKTFEPQKWSLAIVGDADPLFPYMPGKFAAGCNMAFRRSVFDRLGGFETRLGTGTATKGGEDLAKMIHLVLEGNTVAFEPSALVRHSHRRSEEEFLEQVFGYGTGLVAMFTDLVVRDPRQFIQIAKRARAGLRISLTASPSPDAPTYPPRARHRRLLGMAYGPVAYLRSAMRERRTARRS